jgi:beta-carotene ketolase (CrtW type)
VLVAPILIALQTWLSVGLFIVAHDAFHGSLAPGRPLVNRVVGGLCLLIYAGFWFDRLLPKHHAHHASPGTADDPDFHAERPGAFWPWYARFFRQYFGWRELAWVSLVSALYILVLGAQLANVWLFWAAPALLSSLQLFAFGTWLPHRAGEDFPDHHRARSSRHPAWLSLLTCFHFGGFHHEHHTHPHLPWWRLPEARRGSTGLPAPVRDAA